MRRLFLLVLAVLAIASQTRADEPPKSLDPRLKVELFAEHPQIVTPTGLDVDHRGRVFAIESNTHFPPEGYKGHPSDRVLVMSDTDGDGKADKIVVFKDGLKHSMSVVVRPIWFPVNAKSQISNSKSQISDPKSEISNLKSEIENPKQSVYVATRREIFLFHDDDGDDKADRQESIVHLDTKGDYPHNGLAGFAIDALGWMYFGFGENLGADYKIIGSDGTTLSGGGEGGNIYRCRLDGSKLSQIATGFWNPHASCFDAFGRLFTVDNDADSRPPCRLLHVIPGGDYGYRFRNGRKGLHPFTAWNGEIPGTLPMVAGTGEAPAGILAYESDGFLFAAEGADRSSQTPKENSSGSSDKPPPAAEEYLGNLLVTSWGDHRIDRFRLQPKGTSFTSLAEPLITGGENFRPVGLATAPDGSLFCTDWVLRDYKLHGHGRIWRIAPKTSRSQSVIDVSKLAAPNSKEELTSLLKSPSLAIRRMAVNRAMTSKGWSLCHDTLKDIPWNGIPDPVWGRATYELQQYDPFMRRLEQSATQRTNKPSAPEQWGLVNEDSVFDDPFLLVLMSRRLSEADLPEAWCVSVLGYYSRPAEVRNPVLQPDNPESRYRKRLTIAVTARAKHPKSNAIAGKLLDDSDDRLRRLAVQWVAEEKLTDLKPRVEAVFDGKGMTPELFLATLAALEMLDGKKPEDFDKTPAEQYVVPLLKDEQRSPAVRAQALRLVSPTDKSLDAPFFASLLKSDHEPLRIEAIRTLQAAKPDVSGELLRELVANDKLDVSQRADALVGLAAVAKTEPVGGPTRQLLKNFLNNSSPVPLRFEALRAARPLIADDAELRDGVLDIAKTLIKLADGEVGTNLADQLALAFTEAKLDPPQALKLNTNDKPKTRQEWMDQLARGGNVDPAAGRRIFFHPNGPGCFKCHIVDGRGGRVGPDLSRAVGNMNRVQLIQSILEPSREIAPQFVSWTFELHSGKVLTGMIVYENEGKTIVGDAEGKLTELKTIDIAQRVPQKVSVMPDKLAERMTLQELRDVIAFLETQR